MNIAGVDVPLWVFDWSGSLLVLVSLVHLVRKAMAYWHWSNASLLPYFLLFVSGDQFMLISPRQLAARVATEPLPPVPGTSHNSSLRIAVTSGARHLR